MDGEAYTIHRDEDGKCYIEDGVIEEPKEESIEKLVEVEEEKQNKKKK